MRAYMSIHVRGTTDTHVYLLVKTHVSMHSSTHICSHVCTHVCTQVDFCASKLDMTFVAVTAGGERFEVMRCALQPQSRCGWQPSVCPCLPLPVGTTACRYLSPKSKTRAFDRHGHELLGWDVGVDSQNVGGVEQSTYVGNATIDNNQ